jgi:uncharacterized membrane protein
MAVAVEQRRVNARLWGLGAFLCVGVGGYALFLVATGFAYVPSNVKGNGFPSPLGLELHIAASALAILLGPWQFVRRLRARRPAIHRWVGRSYVLACVVGGIAGGSIALFSQAGPIAGTGFFLLAIFWLLTTLMGWRAALRRDFVSHQRWMIRSFALTLAAVTLRIYLPLGIILNQGDFYTPYRAIAWLCWVPNLIIAEWWLRARVPQPFRAAS